MDIKFTSRLTPAMAASVVHRVYQVTARSVKLRFKGALDESEAYYAQAMMLADYLTNPEATDDGAELLMTRIFC